MESAELRSDIEDLEKLVNNISCKESYIIAGFESNSLNDKSPIFNKVMERGSYLLDISGIFNCSQGNKHDLNWTIDVGSQKYSVHTTLYTNSVYGYPFSIRK